MKKSAFVAGISLAVVAGCFLITGCSIGEDGSSKETSKKRRKPTEETTIDESETDETDGNETTSQMSYVIDPNMNNGHSITESGERVREITRTTDVKLSEDEALQLLNDSVTLQNSILEFRFLESTPKDDPGAYQWYKFCVYCDGIRVDGATFEVVCFYDGTIVEGRREILTCTFQHDTSIVSETDALEAYREMTGDENSYDYKEMCYFFTGREKEECRLVYVFRHEDRDIFEACTLYIDAETGERVAIWHDAID